MPDPLRLVRKVGARLRSAISPVSQLDLKAINVRYVETVKAGLPHEAAMERAIGGDFDAVGPIEAALLRHYGLPKSGHLVDVGCGAGRLAKPLSAWLEGTYLGVDLVPDLIAHARKVANRPDWRFEVIDHIAIPEADGRADMVCFFSVLTHLLHEQSYWYLEEAKRVLKPGGKIVFSFLEFHGGHHMPVFRQTVTAAKQRIEQPLNVFIEREAITAWAQELGLEIEAIRGGPDQVVAEGALGQSHAVLRKPD
ncbi:MAG: class I SAM-dependent methyltransferase [Pseudomonadota bacterium]